jgi:sialic acid synthase SpsE
MTKLIAEIGWNHMGDMELAKEMISAAKESGADYTKFQTWSVKRLKSGEWDNDGRTEIYKKAELSLDKHIILKEYCDSIGVNFMSSVFSVSDAKLLKQITTDIIKIPSAESRDSMLLSYCEKNFDKLLISTGTSNWNEVRVSVNHLLQNKFALLHCVSSYPCNFDVVNLPRIDDIEKHFTIDNNLPGRDNKFAILPDDMKKLSKYINISNKVMISKGCDYQECELDTRENYTGRFNG